MMTLEFPNQSRSFEATKNRVRFWGYDSAIEITFFMEEEALMKICSEASSTEIALLDAFDYTMEQIHQTARKIYERSRDHSYVYVLAANDF
jgi:hypothetical protein